MSGQKADILIIGLGVIGTTYGYLFHKAGQSTERCIKDNCQDLGRRAVIRIAKRNTPDKYIYYKSN